MHFADFSHGFVLRMDIGEKIHENLIDFTSKNRFPSAYFQGIGAVTDVEIAVYNTEKNCYVKKQLEGTYELISAIGNISNVDGKLFPHTHVTLADKHYQTVSGRLYEATIAVTGEFIYTPIDIALIRKPHDKLNLNELDLPHRFIKSE